MLRKMCPPVVFGTAFCLGLFTAPVGAGPVLVYFTGEWTEVGVPIDFGGGPVSAGTQFEGSFQLNTAVSDEDPADPIVGRYMQSVLDFTISLGELDITADHPLNLQVIDGQPGSTPDEFAIRGLLTAANRPFTLWLVDGSGTAFANDAIPIDSLVLPSFSMAHVSLATFMEDPQAIIGDLDSLVVIPEPASLTLLATAIAMVGVRRFRGW